jgi:hypothetical protein
MDPDPDLAPALGLDIDPAFFVSDSQDAKKNIFFSSNF